MPFCGKCGAELPEGTRFCSACGEPIQAAAPQPAPTYQQQPEAPVNPAQPTEQQSNPTYQQPVGAPPPYQQPVYQQPTYQAQQAPEPVLHEAGVTDYSDRMDPNDVQQNKTICGLAYLFPILFFLPLVSCGNSRSGRFHANQALLVLIFNAGGAIVFSIVTAILAFIPIIGLILDALLWITYAVFAAIFWIMGMVNGFGGHAKELPIIGSLRIIK